MPVRGPDRVGRRLPDDARTADRQPARDLDQRAAARPARARAGRRDVAAGRAHREPRARRPAGRGGRGQRRRRGRRARRRRHGQRGRQRADVPRASGRTRRCSPSCPAVRRTSSPGRSGIDADPTVATEQILEALAGTASRRCRSAGRTTATSRSTPASASTPRRCTRSRSAGTTGSAISNFMHVRVTVAAVLPLRPAASAADAGAARPGPDRRRAPGVRLERRPVDVLRQPAGPHQPGHVGRDRARGVRR